MRLPARLAGLADLVPSKASVADIGSGHGLLAIALAERGQRVIATEKSARAVDDLRAAVVREGAAVETRVGEGFAALAPSDADVVVVAGMGGRTVVKILETAGWLPRWLVLQPMQDAEMVDAWVKSRGWKAEESKIHDRGRDYRAWRVEVPARARRVAA